MLLKLEALKKQEEIDEELAEKNVRQRSERNTKNWKLLNSKRRRQGPYESQKRK